MTQHHTPDNDAPCPRLDADMCGALKKAIIERPERCELSLGVQFAPGLYLAIERKVRDATCSYDEIGFDVAGLDPDGMAASARALHACSWLVVLRQDGRCSIEDRSDVLSLGLELLRTVDRLHAEEWPEIHRQLTATETARVQRDALDRTAEGWIDANAEYLRLLHGVEDHRAELDAVEGVVVELLRQMLSPDIDGLCPPAEQAGSGREDRAEGVAA